jgi:hypothetical protein
MADLIQLPDDAVELLADLGDFFGFLKCELGSGGDRLAGGIEQFSFGGGLLIVTGLALTFHFGNCVAGQDTLVNEADKIALLALEHGFQDWD